MGKSALDFDDIQAAENRRREVAVLQGASPRATKYEHSELKQMIGEYAEESLTKVADRFHEYQESHPLPGYNFVTAAMSEADQKAAKEAREQQKKLEDLLLEANENEFKVTDTSTGLPRPEPRPETANPTPFLATHQESEEDRKEREQKQRDKERKHQEEREKNAPKETEQPKPIPGQVSPIGSGDIKGAAASIKK